MKNTWKGINISLITLKNISSSVPRTLSHDGDTITIPHDIANTFNNCFVSVTEIRPPVRRVSLIKF